MHFRPLIDLEEVRGKLRRAEARPGQMGRVWRCVRHLARQAPDRNPWWVPFVAAVEQDEALLAQAKRRIAVYLDQAEGAGSSGYLFNIWCFAFPHCRWAIWFDLLRRLGAYGEAEAEREAARFLLIQHRDHHAGLLVKPYPECVDNQAASLVLSDAIVGTLFAEEPAGRNLARMLREAGSERLEAMLGGMPASGYSGEGSTYQGLIVAFAAPFLTEMLERLQGRELYGEPLRPNGTRPADILRATLRLWMPGGLLLPWDDYGYQFGTRVPLAYLARRAGDPHALALLEHGSNWARINADSSGWGFDEVIWTLIYWPETEPAAAPAWRDWTQREVGGALASPRGDRYLMQMWDPTSSFCARAHVNPNSLVLEADGVPLTADGAKVEGADPLHYKDAVFHRNFGAAWSQTLNLSHGCGGAHNAILVDGEEGLRPRDPHEASRAVEPGSNGRAVAGDVTGLYRSVYPDCRRVLRRSRIVDDAFFLVEDLVRFEDEHGFTSRWWFRPGASAAANGVDLMTAEGVGLQMRSLLGPAAAEVTRQAGYPRVPDAESDRVDFHLRGRTVRWLWLLWPVRDRRHVADLADGWLAAPCESGEDAAAMEPAAFTHTLHPGLPPWLQAEAPAVESWAFRRTVAWDGDAPAWLRLPRGLAHGAALWIGGRSVPLPEPVARREHLAAFVPWPSKPGEQAEVRLHVRYAVGEPKDKQRPSHPDTPVSLWAHDPAAPRVESADYADGVVTVATTDGRVRRVPHVLLPEEGALP